MHCVRKSSLILYTFKFCICWWWLPRPCACWDWGFEFRWGLLRILVCCQSEFFATDRSLFQGSPTHCMSLGLIK